MDNQPDMTVAALPDLQIDPVGGRWEERVFEEELFFHHNITSGNYKKTYYLPTSFALHFAFFSFLVVPAAIYITCRMSFMKLSHTIYIYTLLVSYLPLIFKRHFRMTKIESIESLAIAVKEETTVFTKTNQGSKPMVAVCKQVEY